MNTFKQTTIALRFLLLITLLLGIAYPLVSFGVGEVIAKHQIHGSLVTSKGQIVGSALIGQNFAGERWFHSRPSAAGPDGYDPLSSGATNAGPNDPNLAATLTQRKLAIAKEEGVTFASVPADAITSSGSGLDPDISPTYARLQAARVASAHNLSTTQVLEIIKAITHHRLFGFIGEESVNVLKLNLAISK